MECPVTDDFGENLVFFYDFDCMLMYFKDFCSAVKSKSDLKVPETLRFFNRLFYLERNNVLVPSLNAPSKAQECYQELFEIYDCLSSKHFLVSLKSKLEDSEEVPLFDLLTLLVKILSKNPCVEILKPSQSVFRGVKEYFCDFTNHLEKHDSCQKLLHSVLRFLCKFMTAFDGASLAECLDQNLALEIIEFVPLHDQLSSNLFVHQVLPSLLECYEPAVILNFIWVTKIKESENRWPDPMLLVLVSAVFEHVFTKEIMLPNLNLILSCDLPVMMIDGFISSSSVFRKQAISLFKMMLFWVKTHGYVKEVSSTSALFCVEQVAKDVNVWEDLVTLFEVLEEKQMHVIKPVLPKFSRILHHACQKNSENSDEEHFLHPSWIFCIITRMLKHENKYVSKRGLLLALNLNYPEYDMMLVNLENFLPCLLEAIDDQNLYCRMKEANGCLTLSFIEIQNFLNSVVSAFISAEQKACFLRYLLKSISSRSWSSVAMMHFTFALKSLQPVPAWKLGDITQLRSILEVSLQSFESVIRNAIERWLLQACLNLFDWGSVKLFDLSELLFTFKTLHRSSYEWDLTVFKIRSMLSSGDYPDLSFNEAKRFCVSFMEKMLDPVRSGQEMGKCVRLLLILGDCGVILPHNQANQVTSSLSWHSLLSPLSKTLTDAINRPYLSPQVFYGILRFFLTIVAGSEYESKRKDDALSVSIIKCLNSSKDLIEFLFDKCLCSSIESIDDILNFQTLCNAFRVFSVLYEGENSLRIELHLSLIAKCKKIIGDSPLRNIIAVLLYVTWNSHLKKLLLLNNSLSDTLIELSLDFLSWVISENILDGLVKPQFAEKYLRYAWKDLISSYAAMFWEDTKVLINCIPLNMLKNIYGQLIQELLKSLNIGTTTCIIPCIDCIESLIPKLDVPDPTTVQNLIDSSWNAVSDLRGSEIFRSAFSSFVHMLCLPCLMHDNNFAGKVYFFIQVIQEMSETSYGTLYILMLQFYHNFDLKLLPALSQDFVPVLVNALTYGPLHNKGPKIVANSIAFFQDLDQNFAASEFNQPSFCLRVISVTFLLKQLKERSPTNEHLALLIIKSLLDLDSSTRASNPSTFFNSYSHRIRTRVWQSILILHLNIKELENHEFLFSKILDILEKDNQQLSVRYLEEWALFNILNNCDYLIEKFIQQLENCCCVRPAFTVSLLSVLWHLITCDLVKNEDFVCRCFTVVTYLCMAQNFAVRLHGRLVLTKLFDLCEAKKFSSLLDKFRFLSTIEMQSKEKLQSDKGNIYKNLIKLSNDFYFSKFNPVDHFTIETIFFQIPRLSNMYPEEWIEPKYFSSQIGSAQVSIPCLNPDELLKNSIATLWTDKPSDESQAPENHSKSKPLNFNFQKKITPHKPDSVFSATGGISSKNDLIVIASLIDKLPNLGGLCRTCEIFAVGLFVIGSLKCVEDKQFQNLAVSADKWMSMKEVKPYKLREYLLSLKEEGYTLVGAEQTECSQKLDSFVFPKKSALLLGHEKEGMPVDLIQLLDVCVEIPQKGVIRSLNVHVSGALFIWEYAKQHME